MKFGTLNTRDRAIVIAEIGNNHEGSLENAKKLVVAAAECGVDVVKFQTFRAKAFTAPSDPERLARLQRFELTQDEFRQLQVLARSLGLAFVSTPLDLESAKFLEPLVDSFKIASGDNDFAALLDYVGGTDKPVIVSTGLSDMERVYRVRDTLVGHARGRDLNDTFAILHCVSAYPCPDDQLNLRALDAYASLGVTFGYSDHSLGIDACVAAIARGARIVEKHFTLDHNFSAFRDHQLSANPDEMRALVRQVRRIEKMLGVPEKRMQLAERDVAIAARRSIVAARELPEGTIVAAEDLTWMRPANGLPPGQESQVVGKRLLRALTLGEPVLPKDLG